MKRFAAYVLPIVAWCGLIFYLSAQPSLPTPGFHFSDKVMHFGAYFVMGALFTRAAFGYGAKPLPAFWVGFLVASLYGGSDEIHQMFTPGRNADIFDWIADTLGAAGGAASYKFLHQRTRR